MNQRVRPRVTANLIGLKERQEQRNLARANETLQKRIGNARRAGALDKIGPALELLKSMGATWWDECIQKLRIIHVCGVELVYLPTGDLDRIPRRDRDLAEQISLFQVPLTAHVSEIGFFTEEDFLALEPISDDARAVIYHASTDAPR